MSTSERLTLSLPEVVDFNFHIKPILSDRCYACHGPDEGKREAEIRLDVKESAFILLDSIEGTYLIKPGDPRGSLLFDRISSTDESFRMPPSESNLSLSDQEIALIEKWIRQGAEWKDHWAFIKPEKARLPKVEDPTRSLNPIDAFVLSRLETMEVDPSPRASKEKLLRRVSFDLTGLPPDLEAIDSFLKDESETAYERVVDQLLSTQSYGERMTSEWVDLARYAETNGYHHDFERNMWPWRDWVIKAFNDNLSYDQFVTLQLAGDLLPEATYDQQLATAFNRNNRTTEECGSLDEEFRVSYVIDRTNTFSKAFLGLTLECAQCHDHKYDPISQKEYYQLSAFFNQVPEKGVHKSFQGPPAPYLQLQEVQVAEIRQYIDSQLDMEYGHGSNQDHDKSYLENWKEEMEAMLHPVMIMKDLDTVRPTYVLERGLYDARQDVVSHGTPAKVLPFSTKYSDDRLGLAKWLFDPDHPLTARVVVNRYWQMIFGRGLVDTPDDFGNQGAIPTHPELLDWLAVDFRESGWDVKKLLKTMVMSATYQQSSRSDSIALEFDPENRWLSRGGQKRLTAEMVRDQALKIAGLLNEKVGGPSVKPYQPSGLWVQVSSGGRYRRKYMTAHGEDRYRRSLYTYWKRIQPPPAMMIFDAADRNICTVKRQSTNTPLQALVLLNDPQFLDVSMAMAQRMVKEGKREPSAGIENAFCRATSRRPEPDELEVLEHLMEYELAEFTKHPERAEKFLENREFGGTVESQQFAAFSVVANAILNLSESLQVN